MKHFVPVMLKVPSGSLFAVVFRAPTSLPAPGSVRHIVPVHSTGIHLVHVFVLLLFRPEMLDQAGRPVGQSRIHQEGKIGGITMLQIGRGHD